MGVDGVYEACAYEHLEKRPSVCSAIPFISMPLGVVHIGKGMGALIICIAKVAHKVFMHCWERGVSSCTSLCLADEKKVLYDALDMIAQGVLELVPGIGNLAIVKSKWWYCANIHAAYKEKYQEVSVGQSEVELEMYRASHMLHTTYLEVVAERDALRKEVEQMKRSKGVKE